MYWRIHALLQHTDTRCDSGVLHMHSLVMPVNRERILCHGKLNDSIRPPHCREEQTSDYTHSHEYIHTISPYRPCAYVMIWEWKTLRIMWTRIGCIHQPSSFMGTHQIRRAYVCVSTSCVLVWSSCYTAAMIGDPSSHWSYCTSPTHTCALTWGLGHWFISLLGKRNALEMQNPLYHLHNN